MLRRVINSISGIILVLTGFSACGTNTEVPVYPLLSVISPPGTPAIISVEPVEVASLTDETYNIEFDLSYYITNSESNFLGYNLYITNQSEPSDVASSGSPYLPNGVQPSFEHRDTEETTTSTDLIVQRISYQVPPPAPLTFNHCDQYTFRLAAVDIQGVESNQGVPVTACATVQPWLCDISSKCYKALPDAP